MTDNSSKVAIAASIVAIGVGTTVFMSKKKASSPKEKEEESWESHIPERQGSLEEIFPNVLYRVEASGCEYGPPTRNMTIYVCNKKLIIISAIAVNDVTLQEIVKLGTPSILIIPNTMHRCCARVWKNKFPTMKVVCPNISYPKNGREIIEQIVKVDMTINELCQQQPEWKDCLISHQITGWKHFEEIIEVKLSTTKKAIIVCDLLFTVPLEKNAGLMTNLMQWIFDSNIELPLDDDQIIIPKVSRVARIFGIQDWKQAEQWYRSYANNYGNNIVAIMVGHGPPVKEVQDGQGCKEALIGVADQLMKPRW